MPGQPIKALPALLIALAAGLLLALSQRPAGPSRAELAQALSETERQPVAASDLRSLHCADAQAGYACRWRQQIDGGWVERWGQARLGPLGWTAHAGIRGDNQR